MDGIVQHIFECKYRILYEGENKSIFENHPKLTL